MKTRIVQMARPTMNWKLLGTSLKWYSSLQYPIIEACNLPEWKEKGKVFMASDPTDFFFDGGSIVLDRGEYEFTG